MQKNQQSANTRTAKPLPVAASFMIEASICQPQRDCPLYTWDRDHDCLYLTDLHRGVAGLPADLATVHLEEHLTVPVLVLSPCSSPPGTRVQARVLGALRSASFQATKESTLPIEGWTLVTVAKIDTDLSTCSSLEHLSPLQLATLKDYVQAQTREKAPASKGDVRETILSTAEATARRIRETRLLLKRQQRMQMKGQWRQTQEETLYVKT